MTSGATIAFFLLIASVLVKYHLGICQCASDQICPDLYMYAGYGNWANGQFSQFSNFDPFNFRDFNPFPPGAFQGGVFSPDWGKNLANHISESIRNAQKSSGMYSVNGVTTITHDIGGRIYTAQLPPSSSVSTSSSMTYNSRGEPIRTVVINVDGDVSVYRTEHGRTTVTDGNGHIRADGGPFHINTQDRYGSRGNYETTDSRTFSSRH